MKKLFLSFGLALALSGVTQAKTPPEVLKPYKEYRAALKNGDKTKAFKAAKKAWESAEKILGDHKTTGDLANNYAMLTPEGKDYRFKDYESRMRAHKRSIALSSFHGDEAVDVELTRHIHRIETGLTLVKIKNGRSKAGGNTTYFKDMEKALDKYNRRGSTFEGDMEVLRVRHHELGERPQKGIEAAKRAEDIYNNRTDSFSTHYPLILKLFKGNVLKDTDEPIKAALEYQDVMQNLEGTLPSDHVFIDTAFKEWLSIRTDFEEQGRGEEAEAKGVCKCWPYDEFKGDIIPLERIPPIMPRNARRSGHVNVVFDVDENGKPFNIRVLNSTETIFEKPSIESVKKWKYANLEEVEDRKVRKDVSNKIVFRLTNSNGKIIPERD
jgi:TonB family protein